jgi:Cu-Zn family superoxide dismutase
VKNFKLGSLLFLLIISFSSWASKAKSQMIVTKIYTTSVAPIYLGTIIATNSKDGLVLIPNIKANTFLKQGAHGFHLHQNTSCADVGVAAGGHYDPQNTKIHQGPYGNGHLGDLPVLYANVDGSITHKVVAPRLRLKDINRHTFMIHANGDNYSDNPMANGGGGDRVACGVIQ